MRNIIAGKLLGLISGGAECFIEHHETKAHNRRLEKDLEKKRRDLRRLRRWAELTSQLETWRSQVLSHLVTMADEEFQIREGLTLLLEETSRRHSEFFEAWDMANREDRSLEWALKAQGVKLRSPESYLAPHKHASFIISKT